MKCDSVLVAEPELPVASSFLGKVTERCKKWRPLGCYKRQSGGGGDGVGWGGVGGV